MSKIERSDDRIIGGVCAAIARAFDIKPIYVRLFFIISIFFSVGIAILAYLVGMLIIPKEQQNNLDSPGSMDLSAETTSILQTPQQNSPRVVKNNLAPKVILGIITFGFSPLIVGIVGRVLSNCSGSCPWDVVHWFALFTLPVAAIVLFIYLLVIVIQNNKRS
jgi:phage shock protein PspC (stress-responsive transcriptional regulator)